MFFESSIFSLTYISFCNTFVFIYPIFPFDVLIFVQFSSKSSIQTTFSPFFNFATVFEKVVSLYFTLVFFEISALINCLSKESNTNIFSSFIYCSIKCR